MTNEQLLLGPKPLKQKSELVVTEKDETTLCCKCNHASPNGANFCRWCGCQLTESVTKNNPWFIEELNNLKQENKTLKEQLEHFQNCIYVQSAEHAKEIDWLKERVYGIWEQYNRVSQEKDQMGQERNQLPELTYEMATLLGYADPRQYLNLKATIESGLPINIIPNLKKMGE